MFIISSIACQYVLEKLCDQNAIVFVYQNVSCTDNTFYYKCKDGNPHLVTCDNEIEEFLPIACYGENNYYYECIYNLDKYPTSQYLHKIHYYNENMNKVEIIKPFECINLHHKMYFIGDNNVFEADYGESDCSDHLATKITALNTLNEEIKYKFNYNGMYKYTKVMKSGTSFYYENNKCYKSKRYFTNKDENIFFVQYSDDSCNEDPTPFMESMEENNIKGSDHLEYSKDLCYIQYYNNELECKDSSPAFEVFECNDGLCDSFKFYHGILFNKTHYNITETRYND